MAQSFKETPRVSNPQYDEGWERVFGKKKEEKEEIVAADTQGCDRCHIPGSPRTLGESCEFLNCLCTKTK